MALSVPLFLLMNVFLHRILKTDDGKRTNGCIQTWPSLSRTRAYEVLSAYRDDNNCNNTRFKNKSSLTAVGMFWLDCLPASQLHNFSMPYVSHNFFPCQFNAGQLLLAAYPGRWSPSSTDLDLSDAVLAITQSAVQVHLRHMRQVGYQPTTIMTHMKV